MLGVPLFERLPRGVCLTTVGRAYYPSVRRALEELTTSTAGLFGSSSRRTLVIRSSVSFAVLCLASRIESFRRQHPHIQVRLYTTIWNDELGDGRIDLDIRYGHGQWEGFDAERLSPSISVPVCPTGIPLGPDPARRLCEIVRRNTVHIIGCENLWSKMAAMLGWPERLVESGTFVDTSLAALEIVAANGGAAMISRDLTLGHAAQGRIFVIPGLELIHDQSHFVLLPTSGRERSTDALVFREWRLGEMRSSH